MLSLGNLDSSALESKNLFLESALADNSEKSGKHWHRGNEFYLILFPHSVNKATIILWLSSIIQVKHPVSTRQQVGINKHTHSLY